MTRLLAALLASAIPCLAQAGNVAECEVVIMTNVEDESGGSMQIASFRPAGDFLLGVYDDEVELTRHIEDEPIRALMCVRNDLLPDEDDYKILATGVPFAVSQDFDSNESDSLTIFFQDGEFRYKYASAQPMPEAMQDILDARLADFTSRDHGLDVEDADSAEPDTDTSADDPAAEGEPAMVDDSGEDMSEGVMSEGVEDASGTPEDSEAPDDDAAEKDMADADEGE